MKRVRLSNRLTALAMAAVMTVGNLNLPMTKVHAEPGDPEWSKSIENTGLGTGSIGDPKVNTAASDAWEGNFVYYGKYSRYNMKYRVLDAQTGLYGGNTMLLDCDDSLFGQTMFFDFDGELNTGATKLNEWKYSDVKAWLNGNGFLTKNGVFTTAEADAIAESETLDQQGHELVGSEDANPDNYPVIGGWTEGAFKNYVPLTGEKVFVPDAEEVSNTAYGYDALGYPAKSRVKKIIGTDTAVNWMLRSAYFEDSEVVGFVYDSGQVFKHHAYNFECGVSPAFNIKRSSVIFSSEIKNGTGENNYGAEYKLTVPDKNLSIIAGNMTRNGNVVSVAYTITDNSNSAEPDRVSVIVVKDGEWTTGGWSEGAELLQYTKLDVESFANSGTGTFTLSESVSGVLGEDCHVYILAEDENTDLVGTDYASAPVEIKLITASVEGYEGTYDGQTHGISIAVSDPESGAAVRYGTVEGTYDQVNSPTAIDFTDTPITVYYKITAPGYVTETGSADIKIDKVPLTVSANENTITYGDAPEGNGVTYSGFVNNETAEVLGGTLGYEYSYERYGDVGDAYTITPGGLTSDNYEITYAVGKLTVEPKETGLDWSDTVLTYTGEAQKPTATATGLVNGDSCTVTVSGEQTDAGTYTATATAVSNGNYKLPADPETQFTISRAEYTGTKTAYTTVAASKAVTDGKLTLPELPEGASYASTGTVSGNTALITGHRVEGNVLTFSAAEQEGYTSAKISIAVTGAKNYLDYQVVAAIIAKEEAEASIAGGDVTKVYGDAAFTVAGTAKKPGENGSWKYTSSDTTVAEIDGTSGAVTIKGAGTTIITAIFESDTTYSETSIILTVDKAETTVIVPVAKEGLKASDTVQELITAGKAEGGEMLYALGTDDKTLPTEGWSKEVPTAKDAGNYYVWYKVVGDKNHKDTEAKCVTVIMLKGHTDLKGISISENVTVKTGETMQLIVTYDPADASDKTVEWKSSDTDIATVDASGNVKGVKAGYAVVSATAKDGGYTASCKVEVNPAHTDDNAETTWISEGDLKDYKIPEEKKPEYTAESIKIGSKNDSKEVKVSISMNYMDAVTYNGKALTPKTSDEFKFELKLDDILTQAGVSGVKAEEIFKVSFVGKSKDAGEGTFYAKVSLVPKAKSKFKLTKQQEKDLKKIISAVNKVLKNKDNRVKFKINKASIAGLTNLQVYAKLTKDGKLKLDKKDKLTGIKSVKYKKTPADAKYTTLSKKAGYSVEAVDINTLKVIVKGTKNYTGWTTVTASK